MWLPGDLILRSLNGYVELHPTLKAAMRLHRGYDGLDKLAAAIREGRLSAVEDVIAEGARFDERKRIGANLTVEQIERFRPVLLAFVNVLAGGDLPPSEGPKGKAISIEEWHLSLYKLGTGWIGWTPKDTLASTISQIIGAHEGRVEMLQAIFGGGGEDRPALDPDQLDAKLDAIMDGLGGRRFRKIDGRLTEITQ